MKLKIIPIAIILMILISPFAWAAGDKAADKATDKKIDNKVDEGKVIDKTKESKKDIKDVPKELDGKIKVKDSDTSKYKVEKTAKNSIKITKDEVAGEHTKTEVSVDTAYLTELDKQANADGYIGYMRKVGSQVVDVKTIKISDISSSGVSTIPATFSEVILSGFSGTRTTTFSNVVSGQTLDIQDGAKAAMTVSVGGDVPAYTQVIENNASTYPSSPVALYPLDGNANDYSGNAYNGVPSNIKWNSTYAYFNGSAYIRTFNARTAIGNDTSYSIIFESKYPTTGTRNFYGGNAAPRFYLQPYSATQYRVGHDTLTSTINVAPILNTRTTLGLVFNITDNTSKLYRNGMMIANISTKDTNDVPNEIIQLGGYTTYKQMEMYRFVAYKRPLNLSDNQCIYASGSGVSFKPNPSSNFTGYNVASGTAKTLDIDSSVTGIEVVNTAGTTLGSVTVVEYFTEDTAKISDTTNATSEVVHISHSSPSVKTAGTIAYQVAPLYSGTPALVSNNPNATVARNATSFIVSTGYLPSGTAYNYTVTVANDNNHGMWLNRVLQWVGSGFGFVGEPPTDYTNYIGDQIEVTVS